MKFLSNIKNTKNLILDILFLLSGLSLFLFYSNMLYIHIIAISLMILMLLKTYYHGIKISLSWLALAVSPAIIHALKDATLSMNELSEILLILMPSITVGLLSERQRRYVEELKETYISTLKTLAAITDARDSYTQGHSERVARYAALMAKKMHLSKYEIECLEQASLLHDIGKTAVPDSILHKKGPLEKDEWTIIRKHAEHSKKILSNLNFLSSIIPIVLNHHKRFNDHDDYSFEKMSGRAILSTRILTVADAFDAMTSDRPYRDKINPEQALAELERCSGTQFDPEVVDAFKKTYGEEGLKYAKGSRMPDGCQR